MKSFTALLAGIVATGALAAPAFADGVSARTQAKINRARLQSMMEDSRERDGAAMQPCESGNLEIGTIDVERGARVPSEVTVVVDGDVINLGDGRGNRVCR